MTRTQLAVALMLALGPVRLPALARADNAKLKQEVAKLYELGKSVKTRAEAKAQFQRLREMAPRDVRVSYAYALVHLTHGHYREAAPLLAAVLAGDKTDMDAWEVKIWLSTLTKQYGMATVEMQQLAGLLASPAAAELPDTQCREVAEFMGRICGYLEGLAKQGAVAGIRPAEFKPLTAKMSDAQKSAFDAGRRDLIERLGKESERTDTLKAEAVRAEAKRRGLQIQELDRRRKDTADELARMQQQREALREKRKAEVDEIADQQREALTELRTAEARAAGLRRELMTIDERIADLIDLADHPDTTPAERGHLLDEISRWELTQARQRTELIAHDTRLAGLRERLSGVQRRKDDLESDLNRESSRINSLRLAIESIDRDKARLMTSPISSNTRQVRAHKSRAVALTNYIQLPIVLAAEKKRVLESFK